jgi:hypothetical protein
MSGNPLNEFLGKKGGQGTGPFAPRRTDPSTGRPVGGERPGEAKQLGFEIDSSMSLSMIEFIFRAGEHVALPYHYLVQAKMIGGTRVELELTEHRVVISGRYLGPLFNHVLTRSAKRITENATGFDDGSTTCWIERVVIEPRG